MDRKKQLKQFLENVSKHKMLVVNDDGINRHLIFTRPECSTYYFGISTWSEFLCIYGDMGTSVFSRITDMFKFFRMDKGDFNYTGELSINPQYWHEKLQAVSRFKGDKEFSKKLFKEAVKDHYDTIVRDDSLDEKEAETLWEEIENDILWYLDDEGEESLMRKAMDFKSSEGHELIDFWEHDFKEYTYHFIWQLHAIVWGIQQYDKYKGEK